MSENTSKRRGKKGKANKAIKYRLYPTKEQAELFVKMFGCC
ncbi:helix-turn-helix domain-containing protein [Brotaphodocola catenula]|uniref:Helix-turn-helix domain-containing protein n=1 Tax=Brotaphodocola catenula TaxID=2885361 RepID=A0AAE3AK98_9FIRM|nr:helix-turn-helix domain-containing protein [Brotaphodocola catenula]MCC2163303.1 helix-turn-helix domain-containing protein [Brotaphodocola catenula]